jgi:hypothetical protein
MRSAERPQGACALRALPGHARLAFRDTAGWRGRRIGVRLAESPAVPACALRWTPLDTSGIHVTSGSIEPCVERQEDAFQMDPGTFQVPQCTGDVLVAHGLTQVRVLVYAQNAAVGDAALVQSEIVGAVAGEQDTVAAARVKTSVSGVPIRSASPTVSTSWPRVRRRSTRRRAWVSSSRSRRKRDSRVAQPTSFLVCL